MNVTHPSFAGLDLLASAVLLIDDGQLIRYINAAGENLLAVSGHSVVGRRWLPFAPVRRRCSRRLIMA